MDYGEFVNVFSQVLISSLISSHEIVPSVHDDVMLGDLNDK